jgi:hypothetical protein
MKHQYKSFRLVCSTCKDCFREDNYPIQSSSCGHSICFTCFESELQKENDTPNEASCEEYFCCPQCKAEKAFHPRYSSPNLLACAAIHALWECGKVWSSTAGRKQHSCEQKQSRGKPESKATQEMEISPAIGRVNQEEVNGGSKSAYTTTANGNITSQAQKGVRVMPNTAQVHPAKHARGLSSPPADDSNQSNNKIVKKSSSTRSPETEKKTHTLVSHTPNQQTQTTGVSPSPERRLVWIKFGKDMHLAYLIGQNGDRGQIQWESNNFVEEVDMNRIEDVTNCRLKRSRGKTSAFSSEHACAKRKRYKSL